MTGSFSFIQESEIETPAFDEGIEWVEKPDAEDHVQNQANDTADAPAEVGFVFRASDYLLTIYSGWSRQHHRLGCRRRRRPPSYCRPTGRVRDLWLSDPRRG